MTQADNRILLLIGIVGVILVISVLLKAGLKRISVPALVGYLLLGFILHSADLKWHLFSAGEAEVLEFMADIGIISLLFRVGLESQWDQLLRQLRPASLVWLGNVLVSGGLGFFTAHELLKLDLIPSLFIGTAMTATSVGISVAVWQEANMIRSLNGELMLDIAEMDDISAVILMGLLFTVAPILLSHPEISVVLPILAKSIGVFCLKAIIFGTFCFVFSRYLEQSITNFFQALEPPAESIIVVAGISFIIAALAGLLGFSVAIGAFFAGLVFSRDSDSVKLDALFDTFYEIFVPFFFIGIGLKIDLDALLTAFDLGVILLGVAVLGKFIGVGVPMLMIAPNSQNAILLGISMIPRAEIMMIVMQQGLQMGSWAVSPRLFAAMVVVSIVTSIVAPLVLNPLLQRWPQTETQ